MTETYIQSLMVWPGEHPCMAYLLNDPVFLNFAVGLGSALGGEATILKLSDTAAILYNCEALISEMKGNRKVGSKLLAGVFYVVGLQDDKLADLSFADMELWSERLWEPERYSEADVKAAFQAEFLDGLEALE